jgi:hypothetical protein
MSLAPVTNFGKATVSTTYNAAATSIVLTTGHGSRLPSTFPYPLTWWNATDYPDPADDPNREIVTVTNRVGDTLTVTRGAESTGASTKDTSGKTYKMLLGITKAMWESIGTQNVSQSFRGLRLSTHPSADLGVKQTMFSADLIVMNDGEAVSSWSNVVTDITVSGAQGLDTGSELSAVWYEQYAIYNGVNKYGCLHRAKDWFLDLDITANEDASQGIRSAVDNSTVRVAQGITPATAGKLMFIDVKLLKTGTPTGNIWFELQSNSGGVPSNTVLASTWKIDVSRIATTATQIRLPFLVPYSVSASTLYHIVAQGDWTVSATNYISWRMDGSAAAYAGGSKALYDSDTTTWTADTDDDMWLRCYIERNNVDFSTTVPSGYRYALLGYVYNDSGGNFLPFVQHDRAWRFIVTASGLLVNETAAALTLLDLRALVPALEMLRVFFGLTATGAAAGTYQFGDITGTDLVAGANAGSQVGLRADGTAEWIMEYDDMIVRYAAVFGDGTAGADLYVAGFTW